MLPNMYKNSLGILIQIYTFLSEEIPLHLMIYDQASFTINQIQVCSVLHFISLLSLVSRLKIKLWLIPDDLAGKNGSPLHPRG